MLPLRRTHRLGGRSSLLTAALAAAVLAAGAAGCSSSSDPAQSSAPRPSRAFCAAAAHYDERVAQAKIDEQIRLVREIARTAPRDIEHDAQTFLDAMQRRKAGDRSVVDNPSIEDAVQRVNRRAAQGCGWYRRQGSI